MSTAPRPRIRPGAVLANAAVAVGCVLFLGGFVLAAILYQPYEVPTDSMAPTVSTGDRVLAHRMGGDEAHRGDVVVFREETWGDVPMLKRVVGVGGDTVACCDDRGRLTVNGRPVDEPYLPGDQPAAPYSFSAEVPEGELFLLGDDRQNSIDSLTRLLGEDSTGTVPAEAVSARVEAIVWPVDRIGMVPGAADFGDLPGGTSPDGPLRPILWAAAAGAVLILGGTAYGPVSRRLRRRRANR
ncbi:signal peptidase I [Streptomyces sp. YIM 98790]|uniref:signal peptidase I n=1 Tax=Streptomyces sp. YIM 98790 TaxID=2689077 RepID=UPI00140E69D2|nr:signal peptidase I [Streptomyces sp. YIM 98790]